MRMLVVGASARDYSKASGKASEAKNINSRIEITAIALGTAAKSGDLESLASTGRFYAASDVSAASLQEATNKAVELMCKPGGPGRQRVWKREIVGRARLAAFRGDWQALATNRVLVLQA